MSKIETIKVNPDTVSRSKLKYFELKAEDYFRPYKIEKFDKLWAKDEEDANYIAETLNRYGYKTRTAFLNDNWSVAILEVGDEQKMYGDVFGWMKN